jgi:hypothetical protein
LRVASSTTVWLCPGFYWHLAALLTIFHGAVPELLSSCCRVGLFWLSRIFHQLTPNEAPAWHLPQPGSSTEPSNPYGWECSQQWPPAWDALQPSLPVELAPCHCHPAAPFWDQHGPSHLQQQQQ